MKSDSKIYRFFFGRRGERHLPFGAMLLILVPFLIGGLFFQNRNVHFYCKKCGRVIDFFDEPAPTTVKNMMIDGNSVDEMQLYYKGICSRCLSGQQDNK